MASTEVPVGAFLFRGQMTVVAVAAGGALGALARYFLARAVYSLLGTAFPYGTLVVNLLGCFLLGVIIALIEERGLLGPEARSLLAVGFLGAMTTFSTFVYESHGLLRDGAYLLCLAYLAASLIGGLAAFVLGKGLGSIGS
ncbi:MAG TPA: fluoride efflux transporter CrcB [Dehalococcoidia bacterium]|nr:fluoride efflux transporter CrcB [Dehalococcoidia bacterium]